MFSKIIFLKKRYLHIQSLDNVKKFLKKSQKGFVELPENLEEDKKKGNF